MARGIHVYTNCGSRHGALLANSKEKILLFRGGRGHVGKIGVRAGYTVAALES
jgi:hypothetical protein